MYFFLYNRVIYNTDNVETIKDLKKYITDNFKNIHTKNLILSYTINKSIYQTNDIDELIPNILYTLTITPIKCNIHTC